MKNYMIWQEERPQRNEWMECCWKQKPDRPLFPNLHTRAACTLVSQTEANQHHDLMLRQTPQTSSQEEEKPLDCSTSLLPVY